MSRVMPLFRAGSGLMHRPESPLRGGVHDAIGWSGDQPWSGWVKRTSASHRLLKSYAPLFVPHRSLGGRKWEGARGGVAESLSEKKAILERREARLKLSVRAISPAEGGISVGFPQAWYTFSVSVIRVQGRPAHLTMTARHLQQRRLKFTILEALWTDARWLQGMTEYASWVQQEVQSDCWGVSPADPGIREESAKKGVRRWREEIWVAVARAADYIAIRPSHFGGLWRLNRHWLACHRRGLVHFLILDESINVRL